MQSLGGKGESGDILSLIFLFKAKKGGDSLGFGGWWC